jgi:hypothetical protein
MIPQAQLRFTPYAWAKLECIRDLGDTEVGGFGIASDDDPMCIVDIALIKQQCTGSTVEFDDIGVADYFDDCIDAELHPEQFGRVWIHTHPYGCHKPSMTDEKTFEKCFGGCDWAVMYILSKDGTDYCALQYNKIPSHRVELRRAVIDFSIPFQQSEYAMWKEEYDEMVTKKVIVPTVKIDKKDKWVGGQSMFGRFCKDRIAEDIHYGMTEDELETISYDWLEQEMIKGKA